LKASYFHIGACTNTLLQFRNQHIPWMHTVQIMESLQAGDVVEEGTHEELWEQTSSVYHSLVALQEAATDRRDELTDPDLEDVVRQDEENAVKSVVRACTAALACPMGISCCKVSMNVHVMNSSNSTGC
jgi:ABC-type dipeptide/oligopeptide/nickel transport system ATPase component